MKMTRTGIACVFLMVASVCTSFGGYVNDNFSDTNGAAINGRDQWTSPTTVIVSNTAVQQ